MPGYWSPPVVCVLTDHLRAIGWYLTNMNQY